MLNIKSCVICAQYNTREISAVYWKKRFSTTCTLIIQKKRNVYQLRTIIISAQWKFDIKKFLVHLIFAGRHFLNRDYMISFFIRKLKFTFTL